MRNIKFKEISPELNRISAPIKNEGSRISMGQEKFVGEYYYIEVDRLVPFKNQARKIFDEIELSNLSDTIKEHGIRQPLTVIKSLDIDSVFEVVSGERRLRAAIMAGLKTVPCIIIEGQDTAEEIALIENIQRQDLHPIELGDGLASLILKAGWGEVSKLADRLGKDHSTISNYLSYSKLPEKVKTHLVENNIRSRDVLRKLMKCATDLEMEEVLGLKTKSKKFVAKSLLRINLIGREFKIQDQSIYKLDQEDLQHLKEHLLSVVAKIDNELK